MKKLLIISLFLQIALLTLNANAAEFNNIALQTASVRPFGFLNEEELAPKDSRAYKEVLSPGEYKFEVTTDGDGVIIGVFDASSELIARELVKCSDSSTCYAIVRFTVKTRQQYTLGVLNNSSRTRRFTANYGKDSNTPTGESNSSSNSSSSSATTKSDTLAAKDSRAFKEVFSPGSYKFEIASNGADVIIGVFDSDSNLIVREPVKCTTSEGRTLCYAIVRFTVRTRQQYTLGVLNNSGSSITFVAKYGKDE